MGKIKVGYGSDPTGATLKFKIVGKLLDGRLIVQRWDEGLMIVSELADIHEEESGGKEND